MPSLTTTQSAQAMANRDSRRASANTEETPSASRSSQAGGFGLLILLLAALPYDEEGSMGMLEGGTPQARPSLASTANLRFCASLEDVMRAGRRALEFNDEFDENDNNEHEDTDEERRRRRKRKQLLKKQQRSTTTSAHAKNGMQYTTSSDEDNEYSSQGNTETLTDSFASVTPTTSTTTTCSDDFDTPFTTLTDLSEGCLSFAMGFLPLKDLSVCRSVNKAFQSACARDVPSPFAGSLFMRFGETNRGSRFATPPNRHLLKWSCGYCTTQNNVNYNVCRQCGGGNADCQGVRRVFLGQLRKERTTELADWILSRLFPEVEPLHIENHTGKDGRGKGCAWIYVTSAEDEAKILSLNKRMFVDVDDNRQEGVWLCNKTHIEELNNMATARAYKEKRPQVLPRQPLTAEKPGSKPQASRGSTNTGGFAPRSWQSKNQKEQAPMNTQATAQELYEQYSAPSNASASSATTFAQSTGAKKAPTGFPTHTTQPQNPVSRSRQQQAPAKQRQWNGQRTPYQYQPNSINVFDFTPAPVPQETRRSNSPNSQASSGSGSWTHNPYGAPVLGDEYTTTAPHYHHYNQYQQQDYSVQHSYNEKGEEITSME